MKSPFLQFTNPTSLSFSKVEGQAKRLKTLWMLHCNGDKNDLRNKTRKPECVLSFNMGWWILVFDPEPEARHKIY